MIDRLFVRRAGVLVGQLTRSAGEFHFRYEDGVEPLLPEFPERRLYVARHLFALFAERIPARTRPDAAAMMAAWGVQDPSDPFEVLARSRGIRATDRIELDAGVHPALGSAPPWSSGRGRESPIPGGEVDVHPVGLSHYS